MRWLLIHVIEETPGMPVTWTWCGSCWTAPPATTRTEAARPVGAGPVRQDWSGRGQAGVGSGGGAWVWSARTRRRSPRRSTRL
ncbi:MAG: hypothetical protein JWP61_804 [Friedmanniella sp.]|nr:hypothetical protein [Friedmanniella sp.]